MSRVAVPALGTPVAEVVTESAAKGSAPFTTHGEQYHALRSKSRTYNSWRGMKDRCRVAPYYAGRGITVCERWQLFDNFLADMGERPEGMTLDRIDPDGNYEPSNCRWATWSEQQFNRRPRVVAKCGHPFTGVNCYGARICKPCDLAMRRRLARERWKRAHS
jgi:hypothetical protein